MPFIVMHGSWQGLKHAKKALFWSILTQESVTLFGPPFFAGCGRLAMHLISTFFNRRRMGANLLWRNKQKVDKYRHSISRIRTVCHLLFCAARLQYAKSTTIPNSTLIRQKRVQDTIKRRQSRRDALETHKKSTQSKRNWNSWRWSGPPHRQLHFLSN